MHGGTQQMIIKDNNGNDALTIPLNFAGCMIQFRHSIPTIDQIAELKQYCLTQGNAPWNAFSFSDQVTDKFSQQFIDTESYNASSTNLPDDSTVEVRQNNLKRSFYDPSDLLEYNLKSKPAHLVLYTDKVQYANINYTVPTNTDPHYSKALNSKIDWEKLSL
jgi:hypothetical protein